MNLLSTWQFNFFAYLICGVLFYQFYKLAIKSASKDGAAVVLLQVIAGVTILVLVPFLPMKFSTDPRIYLLLGAACIFYAINDRLQGTARKHLEVSIYSIVNQLQNVFLVIIGLLVFKEGFILLKAIGALLIIGGNFLIFYKRKRFELNKFSFFAIMATIAFSVAISIDIGISRNFNLPIYIMLTMLIPSFFIMAANRIKINEIFIEYKNGAKPFYLATGLVWGLTIFFQLRAFQFGEMTTIVPLSASSVIINVLIAYIFLKERDNLLKKVLASTLVMIGIYATVLG